ncbi:putative nucleic acid-binding protein [Hasllibacter halocynthiae]|uniref:Putative nucleic acid-binding protein n=1 Tax=Hasllibacter halocynthiae TaxID=595589 RepID=A0A2T0X954_9RHOB|nr:PIN domain-containing protein [Hasllibacter halocynthiae]PRY95481.1 putative nucleic acid-binding protein [Hasllibacter halocynthiae]
MRALLDANVLYPTVMREVLLGAAGEGLLTPLWSARLLEEWRRAALRRGEDATGEIAAARAIHPGAMVEPAPLDVVLPDPDDVHVLSAAVAGRADVLVTMNLRDFPTRVLSAQGVVRRDPDGLMVELLHEAPDAVRGVCAAVLARARAMDDAGWTMRGLMKKARLPRLGKALG